MGIDWDGNWNKSRNNWKWEWNGSSRLIALRFTSSLCAR